MESQNLLEIAKNFKPEGEWKVYYNNGKARIYWKL